MKKNLFDVPDKRKLNKTVIPTLGGVAIFIGFTLSPILLLRENSTYELRYLAAAVIMMFFIGIKDDMLILSAKKKLVVQLAAAWVLVLMGGFRLDHAYGFANAELFSNWLSILLSVLVILFLINALNLIDGIDGLAASLTLLASMAFGTWFFLAGHINYAIMCASLSGSLMAFLRYNLYGGKNKIFMGDTGSLILGVFLAAIAIKFNELNTEAAASLRFSQAPLLILALLIVPVTDTLRVFAIRIKNRRSPFSPDMNHFHHLLIGLGLSHIQATCFLLVYTTSFIMMALFFSYMNLNLNISFFLILALSFSAVGMIYFRTRKMAEVKALWGLKGHQIKNFSLLVQKKNGPTVANSFISTHKAKPVPEKNLV